MISHITNSMSNCPRCHSQWSKLEFKLNCFDCRNWNPTKDKLKSTEAKQRATESQLQDVQAKLEAAEAKL